ncbi:YHYH domain-containing protein [Thermodesulfobacteriota bacterium]
MARHSRKSFAILLTLLAVLFNPYAPDLLGHPGDTDANGGHYNRKTGEYHYHGQKAGASPQQTLNLPRASSTTQQATSLSASERDAKINDYFRAANENVGALDCGQVKHERDVDRATKTAVKRRDGYRCVICGSTKKLEVDHRRALMNGGANDMTNLATLCDDCHTIKTRMDSSLRRKRERKCR